MMYEYIYIYIYIYIHIYGAPWTDRTYYNVTGLTKKFKTKINSCAITDTMLKLSSPVQWQESVK